MRTGKGSVRAASPSDGELGFWDGWMDGLGWVLFISSYLILSCGLDGCGASGFWFRTAMCLWSVRYRLEDVSLGAGGGGIRVMYVCMAGSIRSDSVMN